MTEREFLDELERRAIGGLRRALGRISGDGFVILGLPTTHKVAVTGSAFTLGDGQFRHALEIHLTHKAYEAWRNGAFEEILPAPEAEDESWFAYDSRKDVVRLRLRARGAIKPSADASS